MLMIRLQRVGRKNDPAFRVVVTEKRSKPKSGELEMLGSYNPKTHEARLKSERISYWLSKGAQASPRVYNLLIAEKVIQGSKINVVPKPSAQSVAAFAAGGATSASEVGATIEAGTEAVAAPK